MSTTDERPLAQYESMRDFSRTPEPTTGRAMGRNLRFVVQKHAASRLHYDVRLEIDGVLKSWPVPKGPSLDPREKRFAAMVEDHPLDYADFEGIIPEGSYGAGEMIVWDTGVYSPDEKGVLSFGDRDEANRRMREELEAGKLSFTLKGRKMRGSWTLVRTSRGPRDWLLIKHQDRHADPEREILAEDRSVYSGLTVEDLKQGRLPSPGRASTGQPCAVPHLAEADAGPADRAPILPSRLDLRAQARRIPRPRLRARRLGRPEKPHRQGHHRPVP